MEIASSSAGDTSPKACPVATANAKALIAVRRNILQTSSEWSGKLFALKGTCDDRYRKSITLHQRDRVATVWRTRSPTKAGTDSTAGPGSRPDFGGKGDHVKLKHPERPGHVVVPHPRKDIAIGTLRNIFRQAGWDWR
jgi:hypothetical protein